MSELDAETVGWMQANVRLRAALDAANAREAAIWAALSRAGVSHGQSVEGLKQGLGAMVAQVAELEAELADERANGPTAHEWRQAQATHAAELRSVAERQREACARFIAQVNEAAEDLERDDVDMIESCRRAPLVTEEK